MRPVGAQRPARWVITSAAATLGSAAALSVAFLAAPQASANCGAQWDPVTANCWTVQDRNNMGTAKGSQGCRPGELGNCRAARQNAVTPGATLPSPADPTAAVAAPRPRS